MFNNMSVYLLVGENDGQTNLYIGETNSFFRRINEHINVDDKDYNVKRDFQYVVLITTTSNAWDKSDVNFLESNLIRSARQNKSLKLYNDKDSPNYNLNWKKKELLKEVLSQILFLLDILNINIFKPSNISESKIYNEKYDKNQILYINNSDKCWASAFYINGEFIVLKDSWTDLSEFVSYASNSSKKIFQKLIDKNIIKKMEDKFVFLKDYKFNSPSQAAELFFKRPSNGWTEWVNKKNKTMHQLYRLNKNKGDN